MTGQLSANVVTSKADLPITQGPSRGRPLQLKLAAGDGEERELPQVNAIDNNKVDNKKKTSKRPQPQALKRS